jgi:hypothetical protein
VRALVLAIAIFVLAPLTGCVPYYSARPYRGVYGTYGTYYGYPYGGYPYGSAYYGGPRYYNRGYYDPGYYGHGYRPRDQVIVTPPAPRPVIVTPPRRPSA